MDHKKIRVRAPLRLGLAGGGTDINSYSDIYGGAVLNATLNKYAYALIDSLNDNKIIFEALDKNIKIQKNLKDNLSLDGKLDLHIATYKYMIEKYNDNKNISIYMGTFCEAPPGSGLGSSSTLVVSMIKALADYLTVPLDDYEIAHIAYKIERIDCNLKGGKQDQYAATFGGFNYMEFKQDGSVLVNPLRVKNWIRCELESSLVLFFTSISRESANIIKDQSSNVDKNAEQTINSFHNIKNSALNMKEALLKGNFEVFASELKSSWEEKVKTAKSVSNEKIDNIYENAINAGALAGKLSGAGGGGFMMLYVPTTNRMSVIRALSKFDGSISSCQFSDIGVQSWTL